MTEADVPVAANQPLLPEQKKDATVKLVGDVFNALTEVQKRVLDRYLTSDHAEADVVSLALTVLQRAIGKSIVIVDETGREDKALTSLVLWKPSVE